LSKTSLAALLSLCTTLLLSPQLSHAQSAFACPRALSANIPPPPSDSTSGKDFARSVADLVRGERDAKTASAILRGEIPDFLRQLQPVELQAYSSDGRPLKATVCVMPDYLAVGSDTDFLRMPMGLKAAAEVATRLGFVLPTPRMVDAIYRESARHLRPQPLKAGPAMRSTAYFSRHDADIVAQLRRLSIAPGVLLAGHKKDVVLSNRLDSHPGRIAIYGWHVANGEPIQPLSTAHGIEYVDYSHGIRLVSDVMLLNGKVTSVHKVLANARLAAVLSDEGPVASLARYIPERRRHVAGVQSAKLAMLGR
jgi:hypothetical protein